MFGYDFNSFLREMIYLIPAVAIALKMCIRDRYGTDLWVYLK